MKYTITIKLKRRYMRALGLSEIMGPEQPAWFDPLAGVYHIPSGHIVSPWNVDTEERVNEHD